MFHFNSNNQLGRSLLLAAVLAGSSVIACTAFAGECPADQKKPNARETQPIQGCSASARMVSA